MDSLRSRGLLASRFRKHLAWARQLTQHFKVRQDVGLNRRTLAGYSGERAKGGGFKIRSDSRATRILLARVVSQKL